MNTKSLERAIRSHLQPALTGFQTHRKLLYRIPPSPLVRGFHFAVSRHPPKAFAVWVFVQPCYIPSETLWFNLGKRLGTIPGGPERWWEIETPEKVPEVMKDVLVSIREEGLPYLNERHTLEDIIRVYQSQAEDPNVVAMEAVAGALALLGMHEEAGKLNGKLIESCHKHLSKSPFLAETLARASEFQHTMQENPKNAERLLHTRISITLGNLGLA
jgi:hypothetical protein